MKKALFSLLAIVATFVIILSFRLPENVVVIIVSIITAALVIPGLVVAYFVIRTANEKYMTLRTQREKAKYIIHTDGHGMTHLINTLTEHSQNLTIDPRAYRNGHYEPPNSTEMAAFLAIMNKSAARQLQPGQMVIEQPRESLADLIDQYPHIWVYGGTGGGKTTLERYIAHRRQAQGHEVLILDSKEHPAKWDGFTRVRETDNINLAINKIYKIYRLNSEALAAGRAVEAEFRQITVVSDEWTSIVRQSDLACQFTDEMTREARKTGIHLVIATQTNLAADIGLSGRYRVVNGFLQLELKKLPGGDYMAEARVANKVLGEYPLPEPLPTPPMLPTGYQSPGLADVEPDEVEPTSEEAQVIGMLDRGESYRAISTAVWGQRGSFYNAKIEAISRKFKHE